MKSFYEFILETQNDKTLGELKVGDIVYYTPLEDSNADNKIYSSKIIKIKDSKDDVAQTASEYRYYIESNDFNIGHFAICYKSYWKEQESSNFVAASVEGYFDRNNSSPGNRYINCLISTSKEFFKEYLQDENNYVKKRLRKLEKDLELIEKQREEILAQKQKLEYKLTQDFLDS